MMQLYRKAETDRSSVQEAWYQGLSDADRTAIDSYCLVASESVIGTHLPRPRSLHGPLSRLAVEYAGIVRRATMAREEHRRKNQTENHTVTASILAGYERLEVEAKSRAVERWYLELPMPSATHKPFTGTQGKKPKALPKIPTKYQKAVKAWPRYKAEMEREGKRAKIRSFRTWLGQLHTPIVVDDEFQEWWNDIYSRLLRRRRS